MHLLRLVGGWLLVGWGFRKSFSHQNELQCGGENNEENRDGAFGEMNSAPHLR